ncbi:MAG: undecaprenyl-diphosphate phosphatase [Xanthomonadales bacterium]|nr:undecaprenyl-diphosphate phosphatase [Xanthomonadales bacterium]
MPLFHIIVLALIQGLTEFLPVSSSAHLILGSQLMGWEDQGLVFDVATHLGTLLAVLIYFRQDLIYMALACVRPLSNDASNEQQSRARSMVWFLALASVPALLVGFLVKDLVEFYLRDLRILAVTTLVFGGLLWLADWLGKRTKSLQEMSWRSALWIGLAQALALVPGVSRSGITITAGRFLGFSADAAARFSFLLAIPIIAAAGSYGALKVALGEAPINWQQFLLAMGFAAVAGWVCIAAFLALLQRVGLMPFIIYRLALGVLLLWLLF